MARDTRGERAIAQRFGESPEREAHDKLAKIVIDYLVDIGSGSLSLTHDDIGRTKDPALQEIMTGLLYLHEDLGAASKVVAQRTTELGTAERELRRVNTELEHRIAELRATQKELVRSERLSVLGQLAGGMAHELRQPLCTMKNTSFFLNLALEDPAPKITEALKLLDRNVAHSERIIQNLLDFANPKPPKRGRVALRSLVIGLLAKTAVRDGVEVITEIAASLPEMMADQSHLEYVFRNIVENALHAMPNGGQLTIRADVTRARSVTISVSDTGGGIAPDNLERIFEPLFTTKAKDIGLGLALARLLIEAHDGTIDVESTEGEGTVFVVDLPLQTSDSEGTTLLADDDPETSDAPGKVLSPKGDPGDVDRGIE